MAAAEEPIILTVPEEDLTVAGELNKDNRPPKSAITKKSTGPKVAKSKKVPAPRKRGPTAHPSYFEMIEDAIATLKDRTGSSHYAIAKFIEDKQKNLPPNFRKLLHVHLKKQVSQGKFVKVKLSYKLPSAHSSKPAAVSAPGKKKLAPGAKPKPKLTAGAAAAAKEKKAIVSKAKSKPKTATAKAKAAEKAKPAAKPKSAAASLKPKSASKRKAPEKAKSEKKPLTKVAKTPTRLTPSRKAATVVKPVKKAPAVKKPKMVKKAAAKKGKK